MRGDDTTTSENFFFVFYQHENVLRSHTGVCRKSMNGRHVVLCLFVWECVGVDLFCSLLLVSIWIRYSINSVDSEFDVAVCLCVGHTVNRSLCVILHH